MILLDKITIKIVKSLPFFPHYGKLPYFFFKLPHFMFSEKCTKYYLFQKNTRTIYQKRVIFCNFRNISSHRNDCFLFLQLFSIIYQALYVRSSVPNVFFCTYIFQNSLMTTSHFIIIYLICVFSVFIGSSVILADIQTGIPLPLLGGNFWGNFVWFIRQNYHKTSQIISPFSSLWQITLFFL